MMVEAAATPHRLAPSLNDACQCIWLDREKLQQQLVQNLGDAGDLLAARPGMVSGSVVFVDPEDAAAMDRTVRLVHLALSSPACRRRIDEHAPAIARTVHPAADDAGQILAAAAAVNSMLVVNAPSLFQQAAVKAEGAGVDVSLYRRRRDLICDILRNTGYEFTVPEGAFYLFPKSPMADDVRFTEILKTERILVSPGRAFGTPGYFRISYAVPETTISGSKEGFQRALQKARG